jgi:hypothetical protein
MSQHFRFTKQHCGDACGFVYCRYHQLNTDIRKDTNMSYMITVLILIHESQYATLLDLKTIARNEISCREWNSDT